MSQAEIHGEASLDEEGRRDQAARLLINPEPGWILNYTVMVVLAALIAGLGMRLDSAPIVIGAMLVAPVMRPVLGLGFSCLTDVPATALRRLGVVLGFTSVGLVGIGWLLTVLVPSTEAELAGEVLARTAPDIRDLLVALAAGAVGAFAILRPRVGDTITGVAIAVALVPPPVAAGIALGESFGTQARGALLLYGTNLVAIVFGTVVTVLALRLFGERPFPLSNRRLLRSTAIVVALGLGAGIPLASSFFDAVNEAQLERDERAQLATADRLQNDARAALRGWLDESEQSNLEIVSIDVPLDTGDSEDAAQPALVAVVLLGDSDSYIPPIDGVDDEVTEALGREVTLGIRLVGVADQVTSTFEVVAEQDGQDEIRQVRDALDAWTTGAGARSRVLEVSRHDGETVFIQIAITEPVPSIQQLHEEFSNRLGAIPAYELVIEELLVAPVVAAAASPRDADPIGQASVSVDGRAVSSDLAVCEVNSNGTYELSAPLGTVLVSAEAMTLLADDLTIETTDVLQSTEGNQLTFTGMFDRPTSGISEVEIALAESQPAC